MGTVAFGIVWLGNDCGVHCLHAGMYCQADRGLSAHQVAQPMSEVTELQSGTFGTELRGT